MNKKTLVLLLLLAGCATTPSKDRQDSEEPNGKTGIGGYIQHSVHSSNR